MVTITSAYIFFFFFFASADFAPGRFAAVSLFVFSKRQSARFVQMAAIKKRISFSLSVFSEHDYVSAKPAPSASRILKQNL